MTCVDDQYRAEHPSRVGRNNSHKNPYASNMILAGAILRPVWSVEVEATVYAGL
jgi:hypothetical protein